LLPAMQERSAARNMPNVIDTGHSAAKNTERWEQALALNAEVLGVKEGRGAGALELARARFNYYFPLLRLGRRQDCYELLQGCRAVFEAEHDIPNLGKVYSALADLQDTTGDREAAVGFEQVALRFRYQAGQPEACAISHNNLANDLQHSCSDPAGFLAHRLAAAATYIQIGSGFLGTTIRNLANEDLPAEPPTFETIADRVEQVEGVRFRALFAALPATYPDGDAAIAAVWQQVQAEKQRRAQKATAHRRALAALPPELAAALDSGDGEAIGKAVDALSPEQQAAVMAALREAGLLPDEPAEPPSEEDLLREWGPLLEAIAAVADGDDNQRAAIEEVLAEIEEKGWMLRGPVTRLWAGEPDPDRGLHRGPRRPRRGPGAGHPGAAVTSPIPARDLRYPQKRRLTLVAQLRCGTSLPKLCFLGPFREPPPVPWKQTFEGKSAQAGVWLPGRSHLTGCLSLVIEGDTSGTGRESDRGRCGPRPARCPCLSRASGRR
jgi:hypothetical protein